MPVRTTRYDTADYLGSDASATAFAQASVIEGDAFSPEDTLRAISHGLGMAAIARLTGIDHAVVCMAFKADDLLPGETTAREILTALGSLAGKEPA